MMERLIDNEVKKHTHNNEGQVMESKPCVVIIGQNQIYFEDRTFRIY